MRELEKGDRNSKSLLANVLDLEGDFILAPGGRPQPRPLSVSSSLWGLDSNPKSPVAGSTPGYVEKELHSILEEIKVISNKIRAEVNFSIFEFMKKYQKYFAGRSGCLGK